MANENEQKNEFVNVEWISCAHSTSSQQGVGLTHLEEKKLFKNRDGYNSKLVTFHILCKIMNNAKANFCICIETEPQICAKIVMYV